jgi:hypothetical protein
MEASLFSALLGVAQWRQIAPLFETLFLGDNCSLQNSSTVISNTVLLSLNGANEGDQWISDQPFVSASS